MSKKKKDPLYYELERISHKELSLYRKRSDAVCNYLREHHYYFAEQRKNIFDVLQDSIRRNTSEFKFKHYQRTASFRYCLTPLSAKGSVLSETGGRFNIGKINPNIPKFAALYIAENKETTIREAFQIEPQKKSKGLANEDLMLINKRSLCVVAVNGMLEQTLDLTDKKNLGDFFSAIKTIKLPKFLVDKAKKIKIDPHPEIKTLTQLYNSIFNQNYKRYSTLFDIPSNSQILGHIAFEAGIQAIKYPSRFTKANCLAIYPLNFENSGSYVEINDEEAPESILKGEHRLDNTNCRNFV